MPQITIQRLAHGGEGVGHLPDGRVCFVAGALPGELVGIEVLTEHRRWTRGRLLEVVQSSTDRVDPPCPYYGACGGCDLQHLAPARQGEAKREILIGQLQHLAGIDDPQVAPVVPLPVEGYRSRARFAVAPDGRLGFRRGASHDVVAVDECLLLTPAAADVRRAAGDKWRGAEEVTVQAAAQGGTVVVTPGPEGVQEVPEGDLPVALLDDHGNAIALRGDTTVVHDIDGVAFQVSAGSFFQASQAGAEALYRTVRTAAGAQAGDRALDLFGGVGLFAQPLAATGARVTLVEASLSACEDAEENLTGLGVDIIRGRAERIVRGMAKAAQQFDVVVVDPPRRGAGTELCGDIAALSPRTIVYVACDTAALARDAAQLIAAGYELADAVPIDQFGHTHHLETVARFVRAAD